MSGTLAPSTPTNRRLAGITSFTVNGSAFAVTEFAWDSGSIERETMTSLSGVDGYRTIPVAPYRLANGKTITGHNLWYTGRPGVAGADATFDFRFEGAEGTVQETGVG